MSKHRIIALWTAALAMAAADASPRALAQEGQLYRPQTTTIGSNESPEALALFYARDPKMFDLEDAYLEWPLPAADKRYAVIDGHRMKHLAADLTAIARGQKQRGQFWGRISGTEADLETRRYVEAQFRALGLSQVRVQPLELPPQWRPSSWSIAFTHAGQTTPLRAIFPVARSPGTPPAGVTGPVVWLGLGTEADFLGRDVKGKIALIYSAPQPNVHGPTAVFEYAAARAERAGHAAQSHRERGGACRDPKAGRLDRSGTHRRERLGRPPWDDG
jgi:hypothetical protein